MYECIAYIKHYEHLSPSGGAILYPADAHFFLTSADNSFPFIPVLLHHSPPHTHTHSSSPSPHAPPSWSCHLSAPAQSLLRPTAHLPPAPLTAPVANANARTHPLRHTKGCVEPHRPPTHTQTHIATHICT